MNFATLVCLGLLALAASPALCRPSADPPRRLLHWAQFPIRVYLSSPEPGQAEEAQAEEAQTVLTGFDEWTAASHGKVCYLRVSDASKADVTVQLEPVRYLSAGTTAVGETTVYSSEGMLKKASIRLAEAASEDLQAAAAHEFGHALGICGHSEDPGDLMYPVEIIHFEAPDQALGGAAHTVTAHDVELLKPCYPLLLGSAGKRP